MPRTLTHCRATLIAVDPDDAAAIIIEPDERDLIQIQVLNVHDALRIIYGESTSPHLVYKGRRGEYDVYGCVRSLIHIHTKVTSFTPEEAASFSA